MHQAKWMLVTLVLVGYLTAGYSNYSEPYKSDYSSSSREIVPSSIQEDFISDNKKEDGNSNDIRKEYGPPFTICADRATYYINKDILTYSGDVFVMQIYNKHIFCRKIKKPKKNSVYFTRNKTDTFKQLQEKWFNYAKEICVDEKECNFISGQKLTIQLTKDKKVQALIMDTEGDETSQFYTYPTYVNESFKNIKQLRKDPLNGEGKQVIYNVVNKNLELHEKAIINQNGNQYKGDTIIYDMNHDLINISGSKNNRSKIILDGIQKETKINFGLTPIAD